MRPVTKGLLIGGGVGSGLGGVSLLLRAIERLKERKAFEAEEASKTKIIYVNKSAEEKVTKDTTKVKEIKRSSSNKRNIIDIRGRYINMKTAGDDYNGLDAAGAILGTVGGTIGSFYLMHRLGKKIRLKQLQAKIDDKRRKYINSVLLNKSAESSWRDTWSGIRDVGSMAIGGSLDYAKSLISVLGSVGSDSGKTNPKANLSGLMLAAAPLGFAGVAIATKKYLDSRFNKHDKALNRKPIVNKIILKDVNSLTEEDREKQAEARELYMVLLGLESEKQANNLEKLSEEIGYKIDATKSVFDLPYVEDPLFKQAVLHSTFYKEGTFYNAMYKQAFLPITNIVKWRATNDIISGLKPPEKKAPKKIPYKLIIETQDDAIEDKLKKNKKLVKLKEKDNGKKDKKEKDNK